jgi:hypothetical protein
MSTEDARRSRREEITSTPFVPEGYLDHRVPHALEYIAIYLEKIEAHLKRIADRQPISEAAGANPSRCSSSSVRSSHRLSASSAAESGMLRIINSLRAGFSIITFPLSAELQKTPRPDHICIALKAPGSPELPNRQRSRSLRPLVAIAKTFGVAHTTITRITA